jgi:uncharacterized protein (TIGR02271 family)
MTHAFSHLGEHIKPLTQAHGYAIEPGDPDPRGWTVHADDGQPIGRVSDLLVDTEAMKVRYFVVTPHDGATGAGDYLLPAPDARLVGEQVFVSDARLLQRIPAGDRSETRQAESSGERQGSSRHDASATVTRAEEELHVSTRDVVRGEARVRKHVETEHVSQPVTRTREELVIERRPVQEMVSAHEASITEDEVRIPLHEEQLVVEKRPVVREEIVIGKRTVEERDTVEADVRKERVDIEDAPASEDRSRTRSRDQV